MSTNIVDPSTGIAIPIDCATIIKDDNQGATILSSVSVPTSDIGESGDIYIYLDSEGYTDTGLGWGAKSKYVVNDVNELLITQSGRSYYKMSNGYAVGGYIKAADYYGVLLISSVPSNAYYSWGNDSSTSYSKTVDGITLYMSTFNNWLPTYAIPTDGVFMDAQISVPYAAANSGNYEHFFDAIIEESGFFVGTTPATIYKCIDIYYKDGDTWKTNDFIYEET